MQKQSIRSTVLLTACACFIYMVTCGIRNNFGLMLTSITESAGLTFASVSFVLAVGQFCFGITQPLSGVLADRRGNRFSLLSGILCATLGVLLLPFCRSQLSLMLVLGILLPAGLGMVSFGLLMGTISSRIPDSGRSMISGIVTSSNGIGNTLLTPVISASILAGGLLLGAGTLAVLSALTIPAAIFICRGQSSPAARKDTDEHPGVRRLFEMAVGSRDYIFLFLGFFTCGFHMALITNHLATQIQSYGYSYQQASAVFSVYGVSTILGSLVVGALCSSLPMKNVLGALYGSRTLWIILFFLLPKTLPVMYAYLIALGATGSSTVPPVSGLCRNLFGSRGLSIFFGAAFVAHQFGGFLSVWLGGLCFDRLGSYTLIWVADAILAAAAAALSFLIRKAQEA